MEPVNHGAFDYYFNLRPGMEIKLELLSADLKDRMLGSATLKLGQVDVVPGVYDAVLPLEILRRLDSISFQEAVAVAAVA